MKIAFYLSLSIFTLIGCGSGNEIKKDNIILQTIGVAIDSITYGALDSSVFVHAEKYPDKIKHLSLEALLKRKSLGEAEASIAKKLLNKTDDSVELKFDNAHMFRQNVIIEKITDEYFYSKNPHYFGTINLTNPIVSDDGLLACYYFAINCPPAVQEDGCSLGFLIISERTEANFWKLKSYHQLWTGSAWQAQ